MNCSRPRSGLSFPNSRHSLCSPVSFLQVTKIGLPETIPATIRTIPKSPKPKGYSTSATSTSVPVHLLVPTAVTAMDARDKRGEASRSSVIHQNAATPPSSRPKSNTSTRTTNTRREFLSETSGVFPAEVSKMDLTALARTAKNWSDLRELVKQQRRKDEQFVLRLLKLEWLQLKTVETERKRDRSKQANGGGGVTSPCPPSSADPPTPLRSMSNPTIHARHGCGQDTIPPPAAKQGTGLDAAALSAKSTASGSSAADAAARRRTALATRPRSSYNYRDASRVGKTVAERRSAGRTCISPDVTVKQRSRNAATPLRTTNKELKESFRIMLGLPSATPSQNRQQ